MNPYDLADIRRKLDTGRDHDYETLKAAFCQAWDAILELQDAVTKAEERANDRGVEIFTLRARLDDAEERLRNFPLGAK